MERFGVQGVQFLLQVILARMLDPEHYGVLSLMVIFTALANVFIQNGFNAALIQNKDVTEEDFSSVLWASLGLAGFLYGVIFLCAPLIAGFYAMPAIVWPLRVLALMLFPGALNSVQLAKVSREMDFKKVFYSNIGGVVVSGIVGVVVAWMDGGLWALVVQTMLNITVACIVMGITVKWRPQPICNFTRLGALFRYGWKLLVSGLVDTLYMDLRSLVIGKKYDSGTLGYYNRGKQFPQFIINAINGAVQSVLLPAMSAQQDDKAKVKALTRNSVMISSYVVFPMMAGLAGIAEPLVRLLLTEKWLPCVPYMQIYCFTFAFYPVHSGNLQAINAMGRSDVFLKLEIVKKTVGIVMLMVAVVCFDSPIAIAMTGVITTITGSFINAYPNKHLIGYSYLEQMKDIVPSLIASIAMLLGVLAVELLVLPDIVTLVVQIVTGAGLYTIISAVFRMAPFRVILMLVRQKT